MLSENLKIYTNTNSHVKTHYSDSQIGHSSITGRKKSYNHQFSFIKQEKLPTSMIM